MMAAREWSENDVRQMIFDEVTSREAMRPLNESIKVLVDETRAEFSETIRNLEVQASQIVIQERDMKNFARRRCTHP